MRLKLTKSYSLTLSGLFDVYEYGENGKPINSLRWKHGSIGRFKGTSQTLSFTLDNEKIKKWFTKKDKDENNVSAQEDDTMSKEDWEDSDVTSTEDAMNGSERSSLRKPKAKNEDTDDDGYSLTTIPWSVNVNYSFGFGYGEFDKEKREYHYTTKQTLGLSGNINPTKNWNITFNTGYDFDNKKFTPTQFTIIRLMHCWTMQASLIPIGPYKTYSFSIAVNSSLLQDLKYNQSSNYRDAMNWGY
jgi:hypothetical protein